MVSIKHQCIIVTTIGYGIFGIISIITLIAMVSDITKNGGYVERDCYITNTSAVHVCIEIFIDEVIYRVNTELVYNDNIISFEKSYSTSDDLLNILATRTTEQNTSTLQPQERILCVTTAAYDFYTNLRTNLGEASYVITEKQQCWVQDKNINSIIFHSTSISGGGVAAFVIFTLFFNNLWNYSSYRIIKR